MSPSPKISDRNIVSQRVLPSPRQILERIPLTAAAAENVFRSREAIRAILDHRDPRLFVVVGPCSIHDLKAAREYGNRLRELADEVEDTLLLVMRVYFEKPRTSIGWKGFLNDPYLDDSFRIEEGFLLGRELLRDLAELGLAVGSEALDPIAPQYLSDFISWYAIGARTTESQTHRELASGLSAPVGIKNGTEGDIRVAINALQSVSQPHRFLGINIDGQSTVFHTQGNPSAHIVLRGGSRPNYDSVSVALCEAELAKGGLAKNIVIDCSHGNSLKNPDLQPLIVENCVGQILEGNRSIVGLMLESNLSHGRQDIPQDISQLRYGVSITDACIDWNTTERTLLDLQSKLQKAPAR